MDKRVLVAAVLSILILVLWGMLFPAPERPVPDPGLETAREEAPGPRQTTPPGEDPPGEEPDEPISAEVVAADAAEQVVVDNGVFEIALTNVGARATSWKLRDYRTIDGEPLQLMPDFVEPPVLPLSLRLDDPDLAERVNAALFRLEREFAPADGDRGSGERFVYRWADGRGLEVTKSFLFRDDDYLVDIEVEVIDRGRRLPAAIAIGPGFGAQEQASSYYYEAWLWNRGGLVEHTQKNKKRGYEPQPMGLAGDIAWAGLEDQYFAALLLPGEQPTRLHLDPMPEMVRRPLPGQEENGKPKTEMVLSAAVPESGTQLYVGPKKYRLLETLGNNLEDAVWFFDIGLLAWIAEKIYLGLLWLHDNTVQNYGVAIILATFLLRVMLFPINQYSMVSMKKMQLQQQRLQPKIKAIRAKYKKQKDSESRGKMNQEMMDLYRTEGVNPMGGITGCLPLLGQFPILIGFYGMLTVAVELRGAPFFGWIQDLSRADPFWILPILMGATMFIQQMMAMSKVKDPVQQQQQRFMMIMPVVFTVICLGLPSGLVLYWFVNNALGIGQQHLVNRHTTRLEAETSRPPGSSKPSDGAPKSSRKKTKVAR